MIYSARPQFRSDSDRQTNLSASERLLASTGSAAVKPLRTDSCDQLLGDELATAIRQRIENRLPGRIRELVVSVRRNTVILAGFCSTYYSKQLAQHAAMGVMEYEKLRNNIEVRRPK